MSRDLSSFLTGIIIIAVIFVLVRPGSQGPGLIQSVGGAMAGLLSAATGGGTWSGAPAPAKKKK
jgi:hypothetical protein